MKQLTTTQLKQTAFYIASFGLFWMAAVPAIKEHRIIGAIVVIILYYSTYFIGQEGIT